MAPASELDDLNIQINDSSTPTKLYLQSAHETLEMAAGSVPDVFADQTDDSPTPTKLDLQPAHDTSEMAASSELESPENQTDESSESTESLRHMLYRSRDYCTVLHRKLKKEEARAYRAENDVFELKRERENATALIERREAEISALNQQLSISNAEQNTLRKDNDEKEARIQDAERALASEIQTNRTQKGQVSGVEKRYRQVRDTNQELQKFSDKQKREIDRLMAKVQGLQSIKDIRNDKRPGSEMHQELEAKQLQLNAVNERAMQLEEETYGLGEQLVQLKDEIDAQNLKIKERDKKIKSQADANRDLKKEREKYKKDYETLVDKKIKDEGPKDEKAKDEKSKDEKPSDKKSKAKILKENIKVDEVQDDIKSETSDIEATKPSTRRSLGHELSVYDDIAVKAAETQTVTSSSQTYFDPSAATQSLETAAPEVEAPKNQTIDSSARTPFKPTDDQESLDTADAEVKVPKIQTVASSTQAIFFAPDTVQESLDIAESEVIGPKIQTVDCSIKTGLGAIVAQDSLELVSNDRITVAQKSPETASSDQTILAEESPKLASSNQITFAHKSSEITPNDQNTVAQKSPEITTNDQTINHSIQTGLGPIVAQESPELASNDQPTIAQRSPEMAFDDQVIDRSNRSHSDPLIVQETLEMAAPAVNVLEDWQAASSTQTKLEPIVSQEGLEMAHRWVKTPEQGQVDRATQTHWQQFLDEEMPEAANSGLRASLKETTGSSTQTVFAPFGFQKGHQHINFVMAAVVVLLFVWVWWCGCNTSANAYYHQDQWRRVVLKAWKVDIEKHTWVDPSKRFGEGYGVLS